MASTTSERARRVALAAAMVLIPACGSADEGTSGATGAARIVEIVATEYEFIGDPATTISTGDTVRFVVRNEGGLIHELQLLDTEARLVDRTPRLAPGEVGEITVTFDAPGVYQVICDVDDHLSRGQRANFNVGE